METTPQGVTAVFIRKKPIHSSNNSSTDNGFKDVSSKKSRAAISYLSRQYAIKHPNKQSHDPGVQPSDATVSRDKKGESRDRPTERLAQDKVVLSHDGKILLRDLQTGSRDGKTLLYDEKRQRNTALDKKTDSFPSPGTIASPVLKDTAQQVLFTSFINPLRPTERSRSWIEQSSRLYQPQTFQHQNVSSSSSQVTPRRFRHDLSSDLQQSLSPKVRQSFPSFKICFMSQSNKLKCRQVQHLVQLGFGHPASANDTPDNTNNNGNHQQISFRQQTSEQSKPKTAPFHLVADR